MQPVAVGLVIAFVIFLVIVCFEEIAEGLIAGIVFLLLGIYLLLLVVLGITFVAVLLGYGKTNLFGYCTFDDIFKNALIFVAGTGALFGIGALIKKNRSSSKA